jgi:hypothetical protein
VARKAAASGNSTGALGEPPAKRWTILLYMAADGETDPSDDTKLARAALDDLLELRSVGSNKHVDVGVHLDLNLFRPVNFAISAKGAPILAEELRESSTGDPRTLKSFLEWAHKTLRADNYLLVLWGHGLGIGFELVVRETMADVAYDGQDGLNPIELKKALEAFKRKRGRPIEIVGFDACFMSSIELSYELRHCVGRMIGTQELMPFAGWPYGTILRKLKSAPRRSPDEVARMITDEVVKSFAKAKTITQTAIDPSVTAGLAKAVAVMVKALRHETQRRKRLKSIAAAMRRAKHLQGREFVDFKDLCQLVREASHDQDVRTAATKVIDLLKPGPHRFIAHHRRQGNKTQGLNGVSIYFRRVPVFSGGNVQLKLRDYRQLSFVKKTAWQKFVGRLPVVRAKQ